MNGLYLVARIADQAVAIASGGTSSAVELGEITPVPRAPRAVLGLAALRSWAVTVIDTPLAIGLSHSSARSNHGVAVRVEGHDYALLADGSPKVVALEAQPLGAGADLPSAWRRVASAAAMREGTRILVLDAAAILDGITQPA
ncbi:chemotaxis protein CheW [Sphingomonas desiccabilis]|uniref:Chemotaxis protein CheW n=1 Tax=Sphingomonas desiccabilis TaxID=429134 RepID=A0A4Q2IVT9_9SPHN|nr:chemotaxis protein CheW [Sphingomonas desiccabilis]MBB3909871.1 purine-binding chemotaxis protein CheW [Sphingomonas desiccabilis]RXZ34546.1 chemotaxis protein CheW [Sphingomonas desiccabilis]